MLNIDDELKKIKEYLDKNITLKSEIVPNYNYGNKISFKCFQMIDNKMSEVEYSFYLQYFKDKNNYANASYLLHCSWDYNLGGSSYADKYESLEDFKNSKMVKELISEYRKNRTQLVEKEKPIIILETTDDTEELTIFDLDNDTQDNQLSLFDLEEKQNDPVEDLLSYGIDEYYMNNLRGETFGKIKEELNKIPKYKLYSQPIFFSSNLHQ